ncbi:hypothetical protein [Enterobacter genomosp. S]|uniref:Uncharacterized protein n=1 Tax=Enterobacter genomosp. S TaxID=2364151 RepID=A0ABR5YJD2_9ENTR|nr:hypothetical protein [Enterobacter genomosp. S]KZR30410.1 hypothetical protein A3466_07900 [Enterobacter genomosp. S]
MGKQVQLSGKCTLKIDTIVGSTTIDIPKVNREGENNADALIRNVIHFGVMRHGKADLRKLIEEKLANYGDEYENKGLSYDDE